MGTRQSHDISAFSVRLAVEYVAVQIVPAVLFHYVRGVEIFVRPVGIGGMVAVGARVKNIAVTGPVVKVVNGSRPHF